MKHFTPLLTSLKTLQSLEQDESNGLIPKNANVVASMSARVGSITDNKLGGWYSYRASKAALNQITKSVSMDLSRKQVPAICVGLHPGTVRTALSKEFTGGPGGDKRTKDQSAKERREKGEFEAPESASLLSGVLSRLKEEDSGFVWDYSGTKIPF
jgi:NAD(P)-dependent dehydrogenase (short-subunit alcohol dehydrogenase family)